VGRRLFHALLAGAVCLSLLFVGAILASQVGYAGLAEPLRALTRPAIRQALALSLGTATLAALLALALAVPCAYALARHRFFGARAVDVLLDLPMVLSPVAVGVAWLLFFRGAAGQWIETHLMRFVFEVPGIVLAQFTVALAVSIRVLKATFQEVDVRYEQVARFLGCTPWGAFRRVSLPLARRGLIAAFVLGWARALGEFGATVTLAGAVPGKTETVPVALYLRLASVDIPGAVALMLVLSATGLIALGAVHLLERRR